MISNQLPFETPEGILLQLTPAGLVPRICAWGVDFLVRGLIVVVFLVIGAILGRSGFGLFLVVYFVVSWLYPVIFEVWRDGQTIGKRAFGIYVCMDNGMPVGLKASMTRNLLILADFLPMAFASGILSMLFSTGSKRLGDHLAGTLVVYQNNDTSPVLRLSGTPVLPPMVLDVDEQRAVLAFAERFDKLPKERADELAKLLAPLCKTDDPKTEILGFAKAILGEQQKGGVQ